MDQRFGKKEKLKSRKLIGEVFSQGKNLTSFPLKLVYYKLPDPLKHSPNIAGVQLKVGVSVPKKKFNKAVHRVHLKRLIREAYRKNKYLVYEHNSSSFAMMFLYIGREKADYRTIETAVQQLLKRFVEREK